MKEPQKGRRVFTGASASARLANGELLWPDYVQGLPKEGRLVASLDYTGLFFRAYPHLEKVVRDARAYALA